MTPAPTVGVFYLQLIRAWKFYDTLQNNETDTEAMAAVVDITCSHYI
jgi:hypothetical protein